MTGHEFTKARTKGAKDKGLRKRKGQRIQELKSWADSEPKYRIKPRKRLSLRGDAPGLHYQYPSRESFGLKKAMEIDGRKYSKKRYTGDHDITERRKIAESKTKTQEFVGETNKALYVITEDGIEKARTPGAKDKGPRKRKLSSEHPKPFPFKNKMIQVNTIFHKPTVPQVSAKPIVRYGTLTPVTNIRPTWTGD